MSQRLELNHSTKSEFETRALQLLPLALICGTSLHLFASAAETAVGFGKNEIVEGKQKLAYFKSVMLNPFMSINSKTNLIDTLRHSRHHKNSSFVNPNAKYLHRIKSIKQFLAWSLLGYLSLELVLARNESVRRLERQVMYGVAEVPISLRNRVKGASAVLVRVVDRQSDLAQLQSRLGLYYLSETHASVSDKQPVLVVANVLLDRPETAAQLQTMFAAATRAGETTKGVFLSSIHAPSLLRRAAAKCKAPADKKPPPSSADSNKNSSACDYVVQSVFLAADANGEGDSAQSLRAAVDLSFRLVTQHLHSSQPAKPVKTPAAVRISNVHVDFDASGSGCHQFLLHSGFQHVRTTANNAFDSTTEHHYVLQHSSTIGDADSDASDISYSIEVCVADGRVVLADHILSWAESVSALYRAPDPQEEVDLEPTPPPVQSPHLTSILVNTSEDDSLLWYFDVIGRTIRTAAGASAHLLSAAVSASIELLSPPVTVEPLVAVPEVVYLDCAADLHGDSNAASIVESALLSEGFAVQRVHSPGQLRSLLSTDSSSSSSNNNSEAISKLPAVRVLVLPDTISSDSAVLFRARSYVDSSSAIGCPVHCCVVTAGRAASTGHNTTEDNVVEKEGVSSLRVIGLGDISQEILDRHY